MNLSANPRLSIGLPVHNGENFVSAALDAILQQTYPDFELIISDNASTDATEAICRAHAVRDSRIKYYRSNSNIGAAANFNRVFELSSGELFKWMAHDDLHHPGYVARCIDELDRDPQVVLAYARAVTIDPHGAILRQSWGAATDLGASEAPVRFRAALEPPTEPLPLPVFGVVRSDVLRRTGLQSGLPDSDFALIAEIALLGRFAEIAEPMFIQREHAGRAGPQLSRDPHRAAAFWSGASGKGAAYPHWLLLGRHRDSVRRAALSWRDRAACGRALWRWAWRQRPLLVRDWLIARPERSRLAPLTQRLDDFLGRRRWQRRTRELQKLLGRVIPPGATVVLADDGQLALDPPTSCRLLPFIERGGAYWGPPVNGSQAMIELDRMAGEGASYMVIAWPAFWFLDFYRELHDYLHAHARCVVDGRVAKVYALEDYRQRRTA